MINSYGINIRNLILIATVFAVSACASLPSSLTSPDPKTKTSWTAPDGLSQSEIYNAAFKSVSQLDAQIVSHDRKTGIIAINRSFPVMFSAIPSQVPITIVVSEQGNVVTLRTTAFLKGMGTGSVYEDLKKQFHENLFNELGINNMPERRITEASANP
jgi:hypothetical protein